MNSESLAAIKLINVLIKTADAEESVELLAAADALNVLDLVSTWKMHEFVIQGNMNT